MEFLQSTTVETFLLKWRLVEAQIVEIAKKDLSNCPTARLYLTKWEKATNELVDLTGIHVYTDSSKTMSTILTWSDYFNRYE